MRQNKDVIIIFFCSFLFLFCFASFFSFFFSTRYSKSVLDSFQLYFCSRVSKFFGRLTKVHHPFFFSYSKHSGLFSQKKTYWTIYRHIFLSNFRCHRLLFSTQRDYNRLGSPRYTLDLPMGQQLTRSAHHSEDNMFCVFQDAY